MAKLTLNDLTSLTNEASAVASLNENFANIETALENTLSRDGTSPNTMTATLDMNSNRITNLPTPVSSAEPATKGYVDSISDLADLGSISSSVTAAAASATAAAASETAAAASAAKLTGTSTTSLGIGTGSKVFTTQSGKFFDAGTWVLITSDADSTNYMHGQVTTYSGTSLDVNVTNTGGSGTLADWTIRVSGTRGAAGTSGTYAALDIASATALTAPATGDSIPIYDVSATTNKRIVVSELFEAINVLTAETAPDIADVLLVYDASAATADKMTLDNFFKVVNGLTADSTPDQAADYVPTYDASATAAKKVLLQKIGIGKQTVFLPAGAFFPATTAGCSALAQAETSGSGSVNYKYLAFSGTADNYAWAWIDTPKSINASTALTCRIMWTPASTDATNVTWNVSVGRIANGMSLNPTLATGTLTAANGTASQLTIGSTANIDISSISAAKQDQFVVRVHRAGSTDASTVAAHLIGIELVYTTDTNTDD